MKYMKWGAAFAVVAVVSVFVVWKFLKNDEDISQISRAEIKLAGSLAIPVAASAANKDPDHFITQDDVPFPPVMDHRGLLVDGQYFKPRPDVASYIEKEYPDIPTRKAMLQFAAAFEASIALGGTEDGAKKAAIAEYDALNCVYGKIKEIKKRDPLVKELEARMLDSPEKLMAYGNSLDNSAGLFYTIKKESSCAL
ncbi:hypothetical protein [Paraburkholderia hayleyella]|uniref:hypothetical protein n=1 Tax=Paraburkholderia hayleyella TaxID=2152889 RepID=UPI001290B0EB|nr:hypothetical protein [Paraburkholderia hayleyella]